MSEKDSNASTAMAKQQERIEEQFEPNAVVMPVRRTGPSQDPGAYLRDADQPAEQFATASLQDKSSKKKDAEMSMRAVLSAEAQRAQAPMGYTKFGQMQVTDADLQWMKKKAEEAEKANFQQWFAQEFDRMSPADKNVAKKLYPEFYAERKRLLKKQAKNLAHLARIKLTGPENFKDLMITYLAESGRLDVGPIENLLHQEQFQHIESNSVRFKRGLLNPVALQRGAPANEQQRVQSARAWGGAGYNPLPGNYQRGFESGFPPVGAGSSNIPSSVNSWQF